MRGQQIIKRAENVPKTRDDDGEPGAHVRVRVMRTCDAGERGRSGWGVMAIHAAATFAEPERK
jgi:hypothetical protein